MLKNDSNCIVSGVIDDVKPSYKRVKLENSSKSSSSSSSSCNVLYGFMYKLSSEILSAMHHQDRNSLNTMLYEMYEAIHTRELFKTRSRNINSVYNICTNGYSRLVIYDHDLNQLPSEYSDKILITEAEFYMIFLLLLQEYINNTVSSEKNEEIILFTNIYGKLNEDTKDYLKKMDISLYSIYSKMNMYV